MLFFLLFLPDLAGDSGSFEIFEAWQTPGIHEFVDESTKTEVLALVLPRIKDNYTVIQRMTQGPDQIIYISFIRFGTSMIWLQYNTGLITLSGGKKIQMEGLGSRSEALTSHGFAEMITYVIKEKELSRFTGNYSAECRAGNNIVYNFSYKGITMVEEFLRRIDDRRKGTDR